MLHILGQAVSGQVGYRLIPEPGNGIIDNYSKLCRVDTSMYGLDSGFKGGLGSLHKFRVP